MAVASELRDKISEVKAEMAELGEQLLSAKKDLSCVKDQLEETQQQLYECVQQLAVVASKQEEKSREFNKWISDHVTEQTSFHEDVFSNMEILRQHIKKRRTTER